jgi:hypothetical protein
MPYSYRKCWRQALFVIDRLKQWWAHRDTLVETACRLCSCSSMRIIYCCPSQLGSEFSNNTGFLPPYSFPLPLPSSLPFSMPALGGCQILTLEAPLITEKAPCMYNGYLYSKDDVRSTFVKPPWMSPNPHSFRVITKLTASSWKSHYYPTPAQHCRGGGVLSLRPWKFV